jgi:hypothetical protein
MIRVMQQDYPPLNAAEVVVFGWWKCSCFSGA